MTPIIKVLIQVTTTEEMQAWKVQLQPSTVQLSVSAWHACCLLSNTGVKYCLRLNCRGNTQFCKCHYKLITKSTKVFLWMKNQCFLSLNHKQSGYTIWYAGSRKYILLLFYSHHALFVVRRQCQRNQNRFFGKEQSRPKHVNAWGWVTASGFCVCFLR